MLVEEEAPGGPLARRVAVAVGVALLALVLYLPRLGAADFVGDDEALDAGVVWQMVHDRDWLFPEFDGEVLPPKPPLFYWEAVVVSELCGAASEWSVRLPSAIGGALLVAMTVGFGARWVGLAPAALGGLLLTTTPVMFGQSRTGRCDMTMAVLIAACLAVFELAPEPMPRGHRWLFYALLGLAALAKAGAAVGLVAVVVVASAVATRRWSRLRALVDPALLAFLVIGGGWTAAATWHWGRRFVDEQLVAENLRHFIGTGGSGLSLSHCLSHFVNIFTVTMPWGFLLPAALLELRSRSVDRGDGPRFLVIWLVAGFVFFSIAVRKSPYYLLPLAPPLSLLVARWAWPRLAPALSRTAPAFPTWPWLALPLGTAAVATAFVVAAGGGRSCELAVIRSSILARPIVLPALAACVALLAALTARAAFGREWARAFCTGWVASVVVLLVANAVEGPLARCDSLRPFADEVRRRTNDADQLFFFRMRLPAVALYAERRIGTLNEASRDPEPPFYLIVPESLAGELPETRARRGPKRTAAVKWRAEATVVDAGDGRVFTGSRMGIRLLRIGADGVTS